MLILIFIWRGFTYYTIICLISVKDTDSSAGLINAIIFIEMDARSIWEDIFMMKIRASADFPANLLRVIIRSIIHGRRGDFWLDILFVYFYFRFLLFYNYKGQCGRSKSSCKAEAFMRFLTMSLSFQACSGPAIDRPRTLLFDIRSIFARWLPKSYDDVAKFQNEAAKLHFAY